MSTAKHWCFTLNNPSGLITQDDFEGWGATYLIYQEEMGESGNHHFQGYIIMPKKVRFTHFKPALDGAHFEVKRGSPSQARDYCRKEGGLGGPYEFGVFNAMEPGCRTDIMRLRDAIRSGRATRDIYDDDDLVGPAVRYARGMAELAAAYVPPVCRADLVVTLHYGPPGTGKTFSADSPEAYYYDGMCVVLLCIVRSRSLYF